MSATPQCSPREEMTSRNKPFKSSPLGFSLPACATENRSPWQPTSSSISLRNNVPTGLLEYSRAAQNVLDHVCRRRPSRRPRAAILVGPHRHNPHKHTQLVDRLPHQLVLNLN